MVKRLGKRNWLSILLISLMVLSMGVLAGCGGGEKPGGQETANKTAIKFGGSSTLAPILAKCADDFTEEFKTWNNVHADLPEEPIVIFVSTGGSGFGFKSAMDKTFDFGMVTRDLKDEEKEALAEGTIVQLGSDVLDVAVNNENPLPTVKTDLST